MDSIAASNFHFPLGVEGASTIGETDVAACTAGALGIGATVGVTHVGIHSGTFASIITIH